MLKYYWKRRRGEEGEKAEGGAGALKNNPSDSSQEDSAGGIATTAPPSLHNLQPPVVVPALIKAHEIWAAQSEHNKQIVQPGQTFLVSIVRFFLTSGNDYNHQSLKPSFYGEPIILELTIESTVESVRKKVQSCLGLGDGEFDNYRIARVHHDQETFKHLENFRGELATKDVKNPYPYNDGLCWIYIAKDDSLLGYLIRESDKTKCASSGQQQSHHNVLTLGFENLKRRGKKATSYGHYNQNRYQARELTIKK